MLEALSTTDPRGSVVDKAHCRNDLVIDPQSQGRTRARSVFTKVKLRGEFWMIELAELNRLVARVTELAHKRDGLVD